MLNLSSSSKKKPISVGDYEISKGENNENLETNLFYNYGFFSNVLEDENKQVKYLITNNIKNMAK